MSTKVASRQSPVASKSVIRKYKNLMIWQKATEFALSIYMITKDFPKEEIYGITSQLRRASTSIAANIAEGSERGSDKEFIRFLRIAAASLAEVETYLYFAWRLDFITDSVYQELLLATMENGKMINGLILKLNSSSASDRRLETGD